MGAVGVAALGVLAVFQIANVVAAGTGRTIMADREQQDKPPRQPSSSKL